MQIIRLKDTDSTNRYLLDEAVRFKDEDVTIAVAEYQTAGRGAGTNKWESEAGKNLLFSILIHPLDVPIREQYILSMTEALALRKAIAEVINTSDGVGERVKEETADALTIKWPNDIYWNDSKMSGTIIDLNILGGKMQDFVIGTGINVNQERFLSDAPNPVSIRQITGIETSVDRLLDCVMRAFAEYMDILRAPGGRENIIAEYHQHLYRRSGVHKFADADGTFSAELIEVRPNGVMTLRRTDGTVSSYEFKEVRFIIE